MFIALTGTPGTGKTAAARILANRGHATLTVEELAREHGCLEEIDGDRVVDVERLVGSAMQPAGKVILEGHLAHFIPNEMCVVLRCNPETVGQRLKDRGYGPEKVQQNLEAEAIDLILAEALENNTQVFEVDTTDMNKNEVADAIERIIKGDGDNYLPGKVDWSEVVMKWY